jgi:tetratricopeptide (TPR) repeat protein
MRFSKLGLILCLALMADSVDAAEMEVAIRADFPGGNVVVVKNEGSRVHVAPDLRGGQPWFYWNFEARASQPGRVTFDFAGSLKIGVRGPAYSLDEGKAWQWLGADHTEYASPAGSGSAAQHESFFYDFTAEYLRVRFAVAIPYLPQDLDAFLRTHAANAHLKQYVLTKTRSGVPVELLQIGEPGPSVKAFIVTARHHACESMASYVMEGFLQEAMSDSSAGVEFRKKYVLYAVPLVDKDGVQAGDQGKNRSPHDHNRDYGPMPIYPEITAIQDLAEAQHVQYALDLHCPALRGDIHEVFHFLGLGVPHIMNNVNELIAWLKEERPPAVMAPLNFMTDPMKPNAVNRRMNSHYFALRDQAVMATTLEIPYTQPNCPLDAAMARQYGVSLLKAWNRTTFVSSDPDASRVPVDNASLLAFRSAFLKTYRGKPGEAEALALAHLDADASAVDRVEANNLLATLRLQQRRFADALRHCDAASSDLHATTHQRSTATLLRLQIIAADPQSTAEQVEQGLQGCLNLLYPANEQQAKALEMASDFYQSQKNYEQAIDHAQEQLKVAATHEKGKILNRIALLYDLLNRPEEAIAARQQAVQILRTRLGPVPERSVFGAMMAADLFEALCGIPTATLEEKQASAALVLNHDIVAAAVKDKVRKRMSELEKR